MRAANGSMLNDTVGAQQRRDAMGHERSLVFRPICRLMLSQDHIRVG